jgi:hypothetical protein
MPEKYSDDRLVVGAAAEHAVADRRAARGGVTDWQNDSRAARGSVAESSGGQSLQQIFRVTGQAVRLESVKALCSFSLQPGRDDAKHHR